MKIGRHEIGANHPCYVIAEIGICHNGSLDLAKQLIDVAVDAGADAVKFQKRTISIIYTHEELVRPRESLFGSTNGDLKRGLEFDRGQYAEIDRYCSAKGIAWFASPWDVSSVAFLEQFNVPAYKVASACITDQVLLQTIQRTGKPVILSTGMSTVDELDAAYGLCSATQPPAMLCCTSTYPAAIDDLHLERIHTLEYRYRDSVIGYSSHSVSPWFALNAVAMGAKIIEAHLTLDRSMWGSDQAASLEPQAFKKLVTEIRDFERARGSGELGLLPCEKAVREKLRRVK